MCSVITTHELRRVGDLPPPFLSGGKVWRTWWLPENRRGPVRVRANEIPLLAAEVSRLRYQIYALMELSSMNLKPTIKPPAHLSGDQARSDLLPGVAIGPR